MMGARRGRVALYSVPESMPRAAADNKVAEPGTLPNTEGGQPQRPAPRSVRLSASARDPMNSQNAKK